MTEAIGVVHQTGITATVWSKIAQGHVNGISMKGVLEVSLHQVIDRMTPIYAAAPIYAPLFITFTPSAEGTKCPLQGRYLA